MTTPFLRLTWLLLAAAVQPGFADEPSLGAPEETPPLQFHLPLDCVVGETCWLMNYVDTDPSAAAADFTCASRTYDGHTGTDIAIRDKTAMDQGVAVLAALGGRVERIRDVDPDRFASAEEIAALEGTRRECGNMVMLDHGAGLQTVYCHLKKGSVTVQLDQQVRAGEKIAEVGLSGWTQFPHMHFDVMRVRARVDPFTGLNSSDGCGQSKHTLWHPSANMSYQGAVLYAAGFHNGPVQQRDVDLGMKSADALSSADPLLTFWVSVMGPQKDDVLRVVIADPDGDLFARDEQRISKDGVRQFHAIALQLAGTEVIPGIYTGKAEMLRAGQVVHTVERKVTISAPRAR